MEDPSLLKCVGFPPLRVLPKIAQIADSSRIPLNRSSLRKFFAKADRQRKKEGPMPLRGGQRNICDVCRRPSSLQCPHCLMRKYCSLECAHTDWRVIHGRYCDRIVNLLQMEFNGINEQSGGLPNQNEQETYRNILMQDVLYRQEQEIQRYRATTRENDMWAFRDRNTKNRDP
jgi:hypothetical protein